MCWLHAKQSKICKVANLLRRTVTGIFIVIFFLGGIWLHPLSFFLTGAVMIAGTQYEYYSMLSSSGVRLQRVPGMLTGLLLYVVTTAVAAGWLSPAWIPAMVPVISAVMAAELFRKTERPFDSLAHTFLSVLYTAVPFSLFPLTAFNHSGISPIIPMRGIAFSPGIMIGFFILLWTYDTGAYLVGSAIGRHQLFSRISPKKTWEGFIGGLLLALLAAWLISGWIGVAGRGGWMVMAILTATGGTLGDLLESLLKRSLGVKDSGSIMPGHGGFLDRFDSVVIAFPLVYLYLAINGLV